MEKEVLKEPKFVEDIVKVIRSGLDKEQLLDRLNDYHEMKDFHYITILAQNGCQIFSHI